jgi:hypothetical protein
MKLLVQQALKVIIKNVQLSLIIRFLIQYTIYQLQPLFHLIQIISDVLFQLDQIPFMLLVIRIVRVQGEEFGTSMVALMFSY